MGKKWMGCTFTTQRSTVEIIIHSTKLKLFSNFLDDKIRKRSRLLNRRELWWIILDIHKYNWNIKRNGMKFGTSWLLLARIRDTYDLQGHFGLDDSGCVKLSREILIYQLARRKKNVAYGLDQNSVSLTTKQDFLTAKIITDAMLVASKVHL